MSWSKRCDLSDEHPKIRALDDRAFRFWNILVNYAARHLTDGHIDSAALDYARTSMGLRRPTVEAILAQLMRIPAGFSVGLLERNGDSYVLHDFLIYNRSRAQVEAEREAARERTRKWRENQKRRSRRSKKHGDGVTNASPARPDPLSKERGGSEDAAPALGAGGAASPPKRQHDPALVERFREWGPASCEMLLHRLDPEGLEEVVTTVEAELEDGRTVPDMAPARAYRVALWVLGRRQSGSSEGQQTG